MWERKALLEEKATTSMSKTQIILKLQNKSKESNVDSLECIKEGVVWFQCQKKVREL